MKMRRIVVTMLVLAMMLVYLPMQASAEEQRETLCVCGGPSTN